MADWDDEEFEPVAAVVGKTDKWAGEDEEDEVKDAWDVSSDEEDSQKSEKKEGEPVVQRKKKKKLADIIAEKEEARLKKLEEDAYEREQQSLNDTPEARMAEKLRQQKLAEEGDLELAKELLGAKEDSAKEGTLDAMSPVTKEDFEEFQKAISEKIANFSNSDHYPEFVEALVKDMCMTLNTITLKKIKTGVEAFHSAKLKEEKAAKTGKKPPKKNVIKMERDNDYGIGGYHDNDMDDFM